MRHDSLVYYDARNATHRTFPVRISRSRAYGSNPIARWFVRLVVGEERFLKNSCARMNRAVGDLALYARQSRPYDTGYFARLELGDRDDDDDQNLRRLLKPSGSVSRIRFYTPRTLEKSSVGLVRRAWTYVYVSLTTPFLIAFNVTFMLFVLTSSVALWMRVLLSSGLAIPYYIMSAFSGLVYNDSQIDFSRDGLVRSLGWLGFPLAILFRSSQPIRPFLSAHFAWWALVYVSQEAVQSWIASIAYDSDVNQTSMSLLFFVDAFVEYYLCVFARSKKTIRYYPKLAFVSIVLFFLLSHDDAAAYVRPAQVFFVSFNVWLCVYFLRFEEIAHRYGLVNEQNPRAFFVQLPVPTWNNAIPPVWSVFHQLNAVVSDPEGFTFGEPDEAGDEDRVPEDSGDEDDEEVELVTTAPSVDEVRRRRRAALEAPPPGLV